VRDLVSVAAAATERCRFWPKIAAQTVKCLRTHSRGAGSSSHPAIFPVVFGELIHANVARPPRRIPCYLSARRERTRGVRNPQNQKTPVTLPLFCFAPGVPSLVTETWDPSTVTIAALSPGRTRRPRTRHLSQCSQETARVHMNAQTNHGRLSDVSHVGHLLANAAQTSRIHVSCADHRLKLHCVSPRKSHSHPLSLVLSVSCYCERLF